jgi:ferredoxin
MKVHITDRCAGHGRCYGLAPEVFEDDDAGFGVVKLDGAIPAALQESAMTAAAACPEGAIQLDE